MLLVGGAVTWWLYEPRDRRDLTWEVELSDGATRDSVERVRRLVVARLAGSPAIVHVRDATVLVTLRHDDNLEDDFGAFTFVDKQLHAPPPRIELRFVDDASPLMQVLTDRVRADRSAADLGVVAVSERRQVGSRVEVEHYLSAATKGRYVNTAWATKHRCADTAEADRERIEGLGVYCIVNGADLIRAYVAGDEDLGVSALEGFALAPDRTLVFQPTSDGARTHLVEATPHVLDPAGVVLVRAWGQTLRVDLTAAAADAVLARAKDRRVVAVVGDRLQPVQIKQDGSRTELSFDVGADAEDLAYAFELAAIPGHPRVLMPGR